MSDNYNNVPPPSGGGGGSEFDEAVRKAKEIAARLSAGAGGGGGGAGPPDYNTGSKRPRPGVGHEDERSAKTQRSDDFSTKIFPPVHDHPDFNYRGLIIGPRGSTLQSMERESGTRILLRGRGTQKAGMPEPDEPLHVLITGSSQDAIDRGSKLVEDLIYNREGVRDRLKAQQLESLATQRGGPPPLQQGGSGTYANIARPGDRIDRRAKGANTAPLANPRWVPPADDNAGGDNPPPPPPPGGDAPPPMPSGGGNSGAYNPGYGNPGGAPGGVQGAPVQGVGGETIIQIPNTCVGLVIGKAGSSIRDIQERSGARVQVARTGTGGPGATTRDVTLTGPPDAVQRAQDIINQIVADGQARNSAGGAGGGGYGGPQRSSGGQQLVVTVPNNLVGMLIGRGGSQIREMQDISGARIQISRECAPGSTEREITITGNDQTIASAQQQIQNKLNEGANRDSNRGPGGGGGYGGHRGQQGGYGQQHNQGGYGQGGYQQQQAQQQPPPPPGQPPAQQQQYDQSAYQQQQPASGYDYPQYNQHQQYGYGQEQQQYGGGYGAAGAGAGGAAPASATDWAAAAAAYAQQRAQGDAGVGGDASAVPPPPPGGDEPPPPPPPGQ